MEALKALLDITFCGTVSSKSIRRKQREAVRSSAKSRMAQGTVAKDAALGSLVDGKRERTRRAGDRGRGGAAGMLPGMHQVRLPRKGRPLPASRHIAAAAGSAEKSSFRPVRPALRFANGVEFHGLPDHPQPFRLHTLRRIRVAWLSAGLSVRRCVQSDAAAAGVGLRTGGSDAEGISRFYSARQCRGSGRCRDSGRGIQRHCDVTGGRRAESADCGHHRQARLQRRGTAWYCTSVAAP